MKSAILFIKNRTVDALSLQAGRLFLWLPVAMGCGAAAYLSLLFEPSWLWVGLPSLAIVAALSVMRRFNLAGYLLNFVVLLCAFALGVMVCKLRTEHVRAPVLGSEISTYTLTAYVVDIVSPSEDQPRLLLAPISLRGVRPEATPLRLRVTLKPGTVEAIA
ncbi:hypothetical protein [Asticcacaulis sp. MM231]|uniref:hypothetical protein n=1 Tax=Asticcacaulis sp. MM231 TaxID=3157666 RepID=UPI0032D56D5B